MLSILLLVGQTSSFRFDINELLESLNAEHRSLYFDTPPHGAVKVASDIDSLLEADSDDCYSDGVGHSGKENRNEGKTCRQDFSL